MKKTKTKIKAIDLVSARDFAVFTVVSVVISVISSDNIQQAFTIEFIICCFFMAALFMLKALAIFIRDVFL